AGAERIEGPRRLLAGLHQRADESGQGSDRRPVPPLRPSAWNGTQHQRRRGDPEGPVSDTVGPRGGALYWALRALWGEVAGFRFHYDAREVPEAQRPGALLYHLDCPRLFAEALRFDAGGVPFQFSRTFTAYNPAYVAWYALQQLQAAEAQGEAGGRT